MNQHAQVASRAQPREALSISARYLIDPTSKTDRLQLDALCLIESGIASVQAMIDGLNENDSPMRDRPEQVVAMLFGLRYQLQMVGNIVDAMEASA